MFTATWSRLGTTLSISGSGIGLGVGDKVIVRNTNINYQVIDVTGVTADGFEGNCGNTGGTSGTEAVYGTLFTAAVTQTSGDVTAVVISAPGGTNGASQLNALSLFCGNQESGLSVTVPSGFQEGAGGYSDKQDINIVSIDAKAFSGTGTSGALSPSVSYNLGANFNRIDIGNINNRPKKDSIISNILFTKVYINEYFFLSFKSLLIIFYSFVKSDSFIKIGSTSTSLKKIVPGSKSYILNVRSKVGSLLIKAKMSSEKFAPPSAKL